jgi:putative ABC transport system permease protein
MPLSTYLHTHGQNHSITVSAKAGMAPGALDAAIDQVRALMRSRRHDRPGDDDTFTISTNETFISLWKQISETFATVVVGIAAISLVVGGVVIMNIMLVSVTERTREIGIRKAVGARRSDILVQFLVEAVLVSFFGGIAGVIAGIVGSQFKIAGVQPVIAPYSIALAFGAAVVIGLFFGTYPAGRAAGLRPIEALRFE